MVDREDSGLGLLGTEPEYCGERGSAVCLLRERRRLSWGGGEEVLPQLLGLKPQFHHLLLHPLWEAFKLPGSQFLLYLSEDVCSIWLMMKCQYVFSYF